MKDHNGHDGDDRDVIFALWLLCIINAVVVISAFVVFAM